MFQLTTSRRGRLHSMPRICPLFCFNSRPHEEVDRDFIHCTDNRICFNSRPHEEVDIAPAEARSSVVLSFNSRPHEEVDCILHLFPKTHLFSFNSRPHEEVDDNAPVRLSTTSLFQLTTSRRGRLHTPSFPQDSSFQFQLTTSRRGRR